MTQVLLKPGLKSSVIPPIVTKQLLQFGTPYLPCIKSEKINILSFNNSNMLIFIRFLLITECIDMIKCSRKH